MIGTATNQKAVKDMPKLGQHRETEQKINLCNHLKKKKKTKKARKLVDREKSKIDSPSQNEFSSSGQKRSKDKLQIKEFYLKLPH